MEIEDEEILDRLSKITDKDSNGIAKELKNRLRNLTACHNLLKRHGYTLQRTISGYKPNIANNEEQFVDYLQTLSDRALLFGIASQAMLQLSTKYLLSVEKDSHQIFKMLQYERQRVKALETALYEAAKQHTKLEKNSRKHTKFGKSENVHGRVMSIQSSDDDDNSTLLGYGIKDEKRTAEPDTEPELELSEPDSLHMMRKSVWLSQKNKKPNAALRSTVLQTPTRAKTRRSRVPDRPNIAVNAWSLLKNSVGKDLSKIPMPVNFNEPLSFLQRMTEELEYADILNFAADIEDPCEQLAYVAAFTVSPYSTTTNRTGKPFNPLLNETYECDRTEDLGWRSIAEQVSHHPPISALFCEGRGWKLWMESALKIKFKGKNLQIVPMGITFLEFIHSGNAYKWHKVTTTVNNIIVGKIWLDQQGDAELIGLNKAAGISCKLTYFPFSMFSRERQRLVKGEVKNALNQTAFFVQGYWDSHVEIAKVDLKNPNANITEEDFVRVWERCPPQPGSEKYHHFTQFTCSLNELEDGVAPTDSRLRPDLRLMEQGLWDESNAVKLTLEEKQRVNRARHSDNSKRSSIMIAPHEPLWFYRTIENDKTVHVYNGSYWKAKSAQDWSNCPNIFATEQS